MAAYAVSFARSARKEFERLAQELQARVLRAITGLESDPRPRGCVKLAGTRSLWRIRVGNYRIVYSVDDSAREVDVGAIRHRSDIYR